MKAKLQNLKEIARHNLRRIGVAGVGLAVSASSFASGSGSSGGTDLTPLTSAISFSNTNSGLMTVAGVVISVIVLIASITVIFKMVRKAG